MLPGEERKGIKMKHCSCIELFHDTTGFYNQFEVAKNSGFNGVEFWTWKDKDLAKIKELSQCWQMPIVALSGDQDYSLCDPKQEQQYIEFAIASFEKANYLEASCCVMHSNALGEGGKVIETYQQLSYETKITQMYKTLKTLIPYADKNNITMVLEPLNTIMDHKGNFLDTTQMGGDIVQIVDSPRCKLLFDMYHMQIMHGNIIDTFLKYQSSIGHIHIADVPGRHEVGTGEMNFCQIFKVIKESGYEGYIGYELSPSTTYSQSLKPIKELLSEFR